MKKQIHYILGFIACFALILLAGCKGSSDSNTVKIGIIGSDERLWKGIAEDLKKENITLQIVQFNDYNQPNTALSDGSIDLNAFQHQYFLDNWNKAHKSDIVSIGKTVLAPIALYSNKLTKVSQLKKGDSIAIPNDATNEGRALHLLAQEGLIKLKATALPTPKDITENKLKLKITALDAAQTARSLSDVTGAVVNDSIALDAKLSDKKVIATEAVNKDSEPYINIIAATKKNAKNKTYLKVVKAYQSKKNAQRIKTIYKGKNIPAWHLELTNK